MDGRELSELGRRLQQLGSQAGPDVGVEDVVAAAVGGDDPRAIAEAVAVLDVLAYWLLVPPERRRAGGAPGLEDGFDALYVRGDPPWEIGRPQAAFQQLADAGEITGRVLDVGCGTGEHVLLAAALGLVAVGIDLAPTAIARAEAKAAERVLPARFEVMDVVDLPALDATFDTVLDCGLFHTLSDEVIPRFVAALAAVLRPGGRYHLLCMSDRQVGRAGPRRISEAVIRSTFADGWRIARVEPAPLEVTLGPGALDGWSATIVRSELTHQGSAA